MLKSLKNMNPCSIKQTELKSALLCKKENTRSNKSDILRQSMVKYETEFLLCEFLDSRLKEMQQCTHMWDHLN